MPASTRPDHWQAHAVGSAVVLSAILGTAAYTGLWVLTAIPVGFLFGFFLQKGDLCGASAFSEVLLMKDGRKVFGLWVCIVVSMGAFALLQALGWGRLNPKPLFLLNHVVGGVVFGIGIVLAGGCVMGSLFKTGAGNLNSMAALIGIPLGVGMVEYGPLQSFHAALKQFEIKADDGGPLTLASATGLPFGVIAIGLAMVTLAVALVIRRRRGTPTLATSATRAWFAGSPTRPWKPWQAGVAIGLLAGPALLSSAASGRNYPLGVTHGVLHAYLLVTDRNLTHCWHPEPPAGTGKAQPEGATNADTDQATAAKPNGRGPASRGKKIVWWLVAMVGSLVVGSWTAARWTGRARLLPKPPGQTVVAFFGGILVGVGAAIGMGCVTGNILSGWALMSVGSIVFGLATMLANWVTTYFYLMGGTLTTRG